jgi:hypothetical protein
MALAGPLVARGDEVTRAEYREVAEPICKRNTEANERILSRVRSEVNAGELNKAGTKLAKAATALKGTLNQLRGLPRPTADQARLTKWFKYVSDEVGYFQLAARELKAGEKTEASKNVVRLTSTANRANAQVIPFEFVYCRLEPSRFT